jgi:hypothetical protein
VGLAPGSCYVHAGYQASQSSCSPDGARARQPTRFRARPPPRRRAVPLICSMQAAVTLLQAKTGADACCRRCRVGEASCHTLRPTSGDHIVVFQWCARRMRTLKCLSCWWITAFVCWEGSTKTATRVARRRAPFSCFHLTAGYARRAPARATRPSDSICMYICAGGRGERRRDLLQGRLHTAVRSPCCHYAPAAQPALPCERTECTE